MCRIGTFEFMMQSVWILLASGQQVDLDMGGPDIEIFENAMLPLDRLSSNSISYAGTLSTGIPYVEGPNPEKPSRYAPLIMNVSRNNVTQTQAIIFSDLNCKVFAYVSETFQRLFRNRVECRNTERHGFLVVQVAVLTVVWRPGCAD